MTGEPLTFLSWNLAMLERSAAAPQHWSQDHTQHAVREIVLDLSPDLVFLQELPGIVPYVETHDMIRANPRSHSGNLATLVGHHLLDDLPDRGLMVDVVPGAAVLATFVERDLTVANVHLAPGRGEAGQRLAQLEAVVAASPTQDLVIVGDTNTRTAEEPAIAALGLHGERPPEPTWDGRRNRFRAGGAEFTAFFTRYFVAGEPRIDEVRVLTAPVTDDGGARFHLSDHFALTGVITAPG